LLGPARGTGGGRGAGAAEGGGGELALWKRVSTGAGVQGTMKPKSLK